MVFWTIETKYYKAELALHLAAVAESPSGGQPKQEEDSYPFVAHGEDFQGVIVVWKGGVSPGEDEISGLTKIEPWYVKVGRRESGPSTPGRGYFSFASTGCRPQVLKIV